MKIFIRICLSLCGAALFATPANAQFYNPWSGWWGAGYYGSPAYYAPSYSSYDRSPTYTSFYGSSSYGSSSYGSSSYGSPSYGCCGTAAPVYAVSYGSGCCAPSCCDPCCDPCGSGCASGSCAGSTPAGTLKPEQDSISDKKAPGYEDDLGSRQIGPDNDGTGDPLNPVEESNDIFRRSKEGTGRDTGSDSTNDPGMFKGDGVDPALERTNQKPPVTDPQDGTQPNADETEPGKQVDEKTFYKDTTKPDNAASLRRESVIARTSSLSEVIAPKRLASRSLPASQRSSSGNKLADKSNNTKSDSPRPLRWISAPLAEGHVQL